MKSKIERPSEASILAASPEVQRYIAELEAAIYDDPLTLVKNRRKFDSLCEESGGGFGVIVVDLDRFKKINDSFGHRAGDVTLKKVARILKSGLRDSDIVCRYGGDEFVVILDDCLESEISEICVRLLEKVKRQTSVTLSIGIAIAVAGQAKSLPDLFLVADKMAYCSKQSRNSISMHRC